ncbi:putative phd finger protein [Cinnamomum micranthum f. kanehirae]|uniref:Putative phd finger protein n=1 Tax=Cinnamomum micranthum f. kanehirae TaxID=337451 RepID=A0A3S3MVC3_9MAGN|nr:putative phd finger protein [Cinnamomum micranthum f. kanehirae]
MHGRQTDAVQHGVSLILHHGCGARCDTKAPTVQQVQVGFGEPPKFAVEVKNNCPMCPVIDIHVKCGNFSQAVVDPRQFKVLSYDDCIVNGGLPLPPLQKLSFNYSHSKFLLTLKDWHFQCE